MVCGLVESSVRTSFEIKLVTLLLSIEIAKDHNNQLFMVETSTHTLKKNLIVNKIAMIFFFFYICR